MGHDPQGRPARAFQPVFFVLWITFFVLAASEWIGLVWLRHTGGYGGLVTAALAFYLFAAEIIDEMHGRNVLPVGTSSTEFVVEVSVGST